MRTRFAVAVTLAASLTADGGCGAAGTTAKNSDEFGWVQAGEAFSPPGEGGFNVRWSKQLTDRTEARYLPVELSSAEFDTSRQRVYVGTSDGNLFAFELNGRRLFFYDAHAPIESKAAVDEATGEVYIPTVDGALHAITVQGVLKWKTKLLGSIRAQPLLASEVVYI
ncbi:MAG: hypothetical protein WCE62_13210, partial [Polyangiales bacterium]